MIEMMFSPLRMISPKTLLISFSGSPEIRNFTFFFWFDSSEFFSFADNQIKMFIKSQKSTYYHSIVRNSDSNSMINPLNEFRLLRGHILIYLYKLINNQLIFQIFKLLSMILDSLSESLKSNKLKCLSPDADII